MEERVLKFYGKQSPTVALHCTQGHFATSHSHINYYIDLTSLKTRVSEAKEVAKSLVRDYGHTNTVVDTIVCMDGTEVIGTCLAEEFEKRGFYNTNQHNTIYVVTPEYNMNNQLFFRDNMVGAIKGKNVILLLATTTTGLTVGRSMECIQYYGGQLQGVSSLFSTVKSVNGAKINAVFTEDDVPGYAAYEAKDCPFCKKGIRLEAMVNGFGYSRF